MVFLSVITPVGYLQFDMFAEHCSLGQRAMFWKREATRRFEQRILHINTYEIESFFQSLSLILGSIAVAPNQRRACMTLGAMLRRYRSRDEELSDELLNHLHDWLQHHHLNGI